MPERASLATVDDAQLERLLTELAAFLSVCRDPWCIFGGAALRLHGHSDAPVADVDVLISEADAKRLMALHGVANVADGGTSRFRSRILLHPHLGDIPIEILAGFEIFADGAWRPVRVAEPIERSVGPAKVFIADLEDIAAIFRLSGRPKDLKRLAFLAQDGM